MSIITCKLRSKVESNAQQKMGTSIFASKNFLALAVPCRKQNVTRKITPKIDLTERVSHATFNKEYAAFSNKPSDTD
jgi:hypothetical protein